MRAPLWQPTEKMCQSSNLARFAAGLLDDWRSGAADYFSVHRWSIDNPSTFWSEVWTFCNVIGERGPPPFIDTATPFQATRFFPNARLNYAENLLVQSNTGDAIVALSEGLPKRKMSWDELTASVAKLSAHLRANGIASQDRVAAILPNVPEAITSVLATATIGATWSSCSPDFGVQGILDRFGQIAPRVLIVCDGYTYGGKTYALASKMVEVANALPSVEHIIIVKTSGNTHAAIQSFHTASRTSRYSVIAFDDIMVSRQETRPKFERLPFNHPLFILFSSGTTGKPKCIVHTAGGILLKHLSEHQLHCDLVPGDKLFYFTTLGWMMWNWLLSGLASGATLMLYDGSPFYPDGNVLWTFAEEEQWTHFGTSAKYIDALKKDDLKPVATHDLSQLRMVLSTGSPLVAESFDYVYRHIKPEVQLASISGGTDICGCFVLGAPILPVYTGEIQCAALGMDVDIFDEHGNAVVGEKGELVCKNPFPSMPLGFWNDPDGKRYQSAYFERYPSTWHHGDFAERTVHNGFIIHGRSDATLNPGGVRIGTAEIYRQVEQLPEVIESLAIGQQWSDDVRIILFVRLRDDETLTADLQERIRTQIRTGASPRHVPAKIFQVSDIPRTKSGKITELAVSDIVHDRPVNNLEALANPEALDEISRLRNHLD